MLADILCMHREVIHHLMTKSFAIYAMLSGIRSSSDPYLLNSESFPASSINKQQCTSLCFGHSTSIANSFCFGKLNIWRKTFWTIVLLKDKELLSFFILAIYYNLAFMLCVDIFWFDNISSCIYLFVRNFHRETKWKDWEKIEADLGRIRFGYNFLTENVKRS